MDFSIDPKLQTKLDTANQFVQDELVPMEQELLGCEWQEIAQRLEGKRKKVKSLGLWAPGLPEDCGGAGWTLVELGLLSEVLGQTPLGHYTFGCQAPDAGNAELLHKYGSDDQKAQYLAPLAAGEIRSCFAMTEPATAGSNPTLLAGSATRDGDEWVINAHKWFTTAADGSEFTIAMVVTEPEADTYRRASMIIVPMDNPGVEIVRNIPVMGHSGSGYFSHSEVKFNDCRVPLTNSLGPAGMGFLLAQDRLGPGRIHHCMRWLGICRRAQDLLIAQANSRMVSKHKKLGDMQIPQAWIAQNAAEIESARMLVLQAAWTVENVGFSAARDQISMIKYHVAGVLQRVVDRALQAHGALGMTDDTILAFYYREERAARIYDGPDEVHQASLARRLLQNHPSAKPSASN